MSFADKAREHWPAVVLPVLVVVIAVAASHMVVVESSQMVDRTAPAFALPVAAGDGAMSGDRISLEDLRGQVVLLDFWASWCAPCRQSIPILNRVRDRYASRGVSVVGVNVEPHLDRGGLFTAHRAFGAQFPSVQDTPAGELQEAYRVRSLPTLVLIGPDGVIRHVSSGVPDEEALNERIESIFQ